MRRTTLAALCLAAVAAAGLTGCGDEDKADTGTSRDSAERKTAEKEKRSQEPKEEPFAGLTGGEIAEKAFKATAGASSLRMTGDVPDESGGGTVHIDMALNKRGDCAGTMGLDGQGEAELIKAGDTVYIKYDEKFLRAQGKEEPEEDVDAAVALLAGKWMKTSAEGSDAGDLTGFCDLDQALGGAEDGDGRATRGRTTTIDGTPAITLEARDGADRFTLYVATEGEPYLLRLDSTSPSDPGSLSFGDYDEPVPVEKPAGDVLDIDSLS
ncbi:lipoprotein [Streptomyces atrovirens]|uniref:Lipoprotein n=1 Tax=Streptomyces atrovirens TaxID=285556 RepID=A0ABW0DXV7_9ACTN